MFCPYLNATRSVLNDGASLYKRAEPQQFGARRAAPGDRSLLEREGLAIKPFYDRILQQR